ncbi:Rpn family recombination-promoting nuclease/putative transposase [Desulfococcaceae bacterium HSG7]|nr:Rpn family recombination-promoting nuclease/putative transposase [Desulfococcaceae bacterium HSG7]
MGKRKLVSFDWAMKRLLRSKANYEVLEGFLSELLKENITILEVLESESNKDDKYDKSNRVDLKVETDAKEIIIIEIQYDREFDYLQRILFGVSKTITEHIVESDPYYKVRKVISVNILYFDLGKGKDYIYKGLTVFRGLHHNDMLRLSPKQKQLYKAERIADIYPEYYLIKINQFDDVARDTLDEWIYFFKNEEIKDEFKAKGLAKAKAVLDIMKLSTEERRLYEKYADNLRYQASMFQSTYVAGELDGMKKGKEEGRKEGLKEGRKEGLKEGIKEGKTEGLIEGLIEGKIDVAINLLDILDDKIISAKTGLSLDKVKRLRHKQT